MTHVPQAAGESLASRPAGGYAGRRVPAATRAAVGTGPDHRILLASCSAEPVREFGPLFAKGFQIELFRQREIEYPDSLPFLQFLQTHLPAITEAHGIPVCIHGRGDLRE